MFDRKTFFDYCRTTVMGPTLDQGEVDGSTIILEHLAGAPIAYAAYALATAWHETAHSMLPVKEFGGDGYFFRMYDPAGQRPKVAKRLGNTKRGDGVKYCGRGYVQLTGRANYAAAGLHLGLDLTDHPEEVTDPTIAARVMRWGMTDGVFTGVSFRDKLPANRIGTELEFFTARKIINGVDRAQDIAEYALEFQEALYRGRWG